MGPGGWGGIGYFTIFLISQLPRVLWRHPLGRSKTVIFWFVSEAFLVLETGLNCDFRTGSILLQKLAFGPMRGYLEVASVYKKRYFEFGS